MNNSIQTLKISEPEDSHAIYKWLIDTHIARTNSSETTSAPGYFNTSINSQILDVVPQEYIDDIFDYDSYELPDNGELVVSIGVIGKVLYIFQNDKPELDDFICFKLNIKESEVHDFFRYRVSSKAIIPSPDDRLSITRDLISEMFCMWLGDDIHSLLLRLYSFVERLNSTVLYDTVPSLLCDN